MNKITIERVDFTRCNDCIFYSDREGGCAIAFDAEQAPFACRVADKNMMWIKVETDEND